jgi:hypothetical protein
MLAGMSRWIAVALALAACSKEKSEGLPPAKEWVDPTGATATDTTRPAGPHGAAPNNPHAGMDMGGGNPHAGMDMGGGNPHAGMDMGGGGGVDVSQLNLPAPDPNRPIDPTHHVRGVIRVDSKAKDRVKPGTAVFVVVKRADNNGAASGPPLAVEKLSWQGDGMAFELTEAQAMIGGTQLVGDVVVEARYDQDGDALSKQPGDVKGSVRVTIPADGVKLVLDTIL